MKRINRALLLSAVVAVVIPFASFATALAQQPAAPPPAAPPPPAPPPAAAPPPPPAAPAESTTVVPLPPVEVPSAAPAAMPDEPPVPSPEERLGTVEAKVDGMGESLAATSAIAESLNKIKLSGYIQGRYEWHDDSVPGLNMAGTTATNTSRFFVRRGRLKVTYAGTNMEYVLQIDATATGVALRDAEATFVDTWTPFNFRLTVGQFKVPFGYEVLQSSQYREMPERSAVVRRLFPGERDRGIRLQARRDWFRLSVALINGTFDEAVYINTDQTDHKDLVGRIGADFGFLTFGFSGQLGRTLKNFPVMGGAPIQLDGFARWRAGVDAQYYLDIDGVGGLALKGEYIMAKDTSEGFSGVNGTPANAAHDLASKGWILTLVQNFGDRIGIVFRVDQFDPSDKVETDKLTGYGGGLLLYPSGNLRATLVYEHLVEQAMKRDNDIFTAQLQASF